MTDSMIVSLRAETHIHVGTGQASGAIDLPVARERATHYPFIPGSGVKGAFRVWAKENAQWDVAQITSLFGQADGSQDTGGLSQAGSLLFQDARLLLLPVRSLNSDFKWVTCPALLRRFSNDCERFLRSGLTLGNGSPVRGEYQGVTTTGGFMGLEEREFSKSPTGIDESLADILTRVVGESVDERLVILHNDDFVWFAKNALPIMARNSLDKNKNSKNLWYEESLAPETIMYLGLSERRAGYIGKLREAMGTLTYIQMGGNETIGQGWFKLADWKPEATNA